MTDADSIETTDVRGACCWCDGELQPHHFVQAVGAWTYVLCSESCLRAKLAADAAARWAVRRRALKWTLIATSIIAACITPHDGPLSLHAAARVPATVAAAIAPLPGA